MKSKEEIEDKINLFIDVLKKLPKVKKTGPDGTSYEITADPYKILAISAALRELEWVLE